VDDVTLECGRVCEGNSADVPSADVVVVGGRTAEYWLYRECDGASVDEPAAEFGMLENWLYKVCDVVGMAPSVDAAKVGGRSEECWL
jgi:hypothetical protein